MNDMDLLRLAGRAAGIPKKVIGAKPGLHFLYKETDGIDGAHRQWNPLVDDGDALRLAVKLGLRIFTPDSEPTAVADQYPNGPRAGVDANGFPQAATRRAIVCAAAQIGEAMP